MTGSTEQSSVDANEAALVKALKTYYKLCCESKNKTILILDPALIKSIRTFVADTRAAVSLYVCKILLVLTEDPSDAASLAKADGVIAAVSKACEEALPPRIIRNLLVVYSRLSAAKDLRASNAPAQQKKFAFSAGTKQLVFLFDPPTDEQRKKVERACLQTKGVVSVCFESSAHNKCLIRCKETVEAKAVARIILGCGFEMIQQLVRDADGARQHFNFYREELLGDAEPKKEMPAYLDDNIEIFDPTQCIVTKDQLNAGQDSSSWLSSIKSFFW
ncbi:Protein K05C4.7 [Aphelenchoides avenae]|nr:Protein K05C4.7 [Aphelenchus avenae]